MNLGSTVRRDSAAAAFGFLAAANLFLAGPWTGGQTSGGPAAAPEEITVQRINVVEPDGSLKMVISNSAKMHAGRVGGVELPARQRPAGVLFFDDEGEEAGGLGIYGTKEFRQGGFLIDQMGNDETLRFMSQQMRRDGRFVHQAGLSIADRNPDLTLAEVMERSEEVRALQDPAEQEERAKELQRQGVFGADRMFVGRRGDGGVVVDMRDSSGATRLRLGVSADGAASIEFLDDAGQVIKSLSADS